ncbi:unnamed protein product [Candidula unifasciata]|uniref:Tetraspanin n=1 Tax=Candidula unifasciata TaxID=100452 RepID=A0A8S3Z5M9_9EUPU|nr:unnamed protein product [Candidula unifasciata]
MTLQQCDTSNERTRLREMYDDYSEVGICTKYSLFFENFLLWFAGTFVTALGAYILVVKQKKVYDVLDFLLDPACILCLGGSVATVVCFIGLCGALRENTCFLKTYYLILCLALLAQLTAAILMIVCYYVPDWKHAIFPSDTFNQAIVRYRDDPDFQQLIDSLQTELGCCGVSDSDVGFLDWNNNVYFNCSIDSESPEKCSVPYSCCRRIPGEKMNYRCGTDTLQNDGGVEPNLANTYKIYTTGCFRAVGEWINDHVLVVGGVMLGILLPQIVVLFLTKNLILMIYLQKSKW